MRMARNCMCMSFISSCKYSARNYAVCFVFCRVCSEKRLDAAERYAIVLHARAERDSHPDP